jgi:hypothetical protein
LGGLPGKTLIGTVLLDQRSGDESIQICQDLDVKFSELRRFHFFPNLVANPNVPNNKILIYREKNFGKELELTDFSPEWCSHLLPTVTIKEEGSKDVRTINAEEILDIVFRQNF